MAAKCERCGQTILPDETVCWQCGAQLTPTPGTAVSTPTAANDGDGLPSVSWVMLTYLVVVTAVTLLLLIWFMSLLA